MIEAIDPPRRIVLATTETRPDGSSLKFAGAFTFVDRHGRTLMTFTQSGFPTEALREEHGRGVPRAFAQFERVVRP